MTRGWGNTPNLSVSTPMATIGNNNWHYVVTGYDGANSFIYVDGQRVAYVARQDFAETVHVMWIGGGSWYDGYTHYYEYKGLMDDLSIWNTSKTATQVYDLYVNGIHPIDAPSFKTELSGYFTGTGVSMTSDQLDALTNAAMNDSAGTVTSLGGGMTHYEPNLAGSLGSYYYNFSTLATKPASYFWDWSSITGGAYTSLNDWYNKVSTGTFITANGNTTIEGNEVWFMKTGGGDEGGGGVPEPAGVGVWVAIVVIGFRRFRK